ncbi:MAG: hypothetical protein ABSB12_01720 [Candidatus Saccharimonadales bacterium]|jgi:hypothetical protein
MGISDKTLSQPEAAVSIKDEDRIELVASLILEILDEEETALETESCTSS